MQRDLPWDMMSLAFPVTWGTSNGTFKTSLRAKMRALAFFSRKLTKAQENTGEKHVLRMLFDSGSEGDIMFMSKKMQRDLPWDMMSLAFPVTWGTSNGTFKTSLRAKMG
eukprot:scaffold5355_cov97-Skeletonema_marinoi.AAC.2